MTLSCRKSGRKTSGCVKRFFEAAFGTKKEVTNMQAPVKGERQVAATLYYLSDEGRMRKTTNAFGLSRSSMSIIVQKGTHVIAAHLGQSWTSTLQSLKVKMQ